MAAASHLGSFSVAYARVYIFHGGVIDDPIQFPDDENHRAAVHFAHRQPAAAAAAATVV